MIGNNIYQDIKNLFYLNRSLTGRGTLDTLKYFKKKIKNLKIVSVSSNSKVYDWKVPLQWEIKNAWISNNKNQKIIDFKKNNLHVVGYSHKVNKIISKKDLLKKIFTIKNNPKAIPYVTSYYKKDWGFCVAYNQMKLFNSNSYKVFIDSQLKKGKLNYGEIFLRGQSKKEILLSANICHPSMVSNELSGPTILLSISKWLMKKKRKFSYRIIFIPETIGSIVFLKKNFKKINKNIIGGYTLTCLGDNGPFTFIESKDHSITNFLTKKVLKKYKKRKIYNFLSRGSDERQYCSPQINFPIGSLCRSKHSQFKEYHTSLDNLTITNGKILQESFNYIKKCLLSFENQEIYQTLIKCEPFLLKRKLYTDFSSHIKNKKIKNKDILDIIAYCDGKKSVDEISEILKISIIKIKKNINILLKNKLIKRIV